MAIPQQDRFLRIPKGPLGEGEVVLTSLSGNEAMSRLYNFQLEFVSTKLDLKAKDLVGQPMTIEIDRRDKDDKKLPSRFINGYISRFTAGDVTTGADAKTGKFREYRAELVPWLWFLTQTARCYIFFPEKEDKTVFEIIEEVFNRAKNELHIDPKVDLKGIDELKQRKVKHCVQYRETDFNFLSRIMEQYGVYYYFTQKDGEHKLMLSMKVDYPEAGEKEITYPRDTAKTKVDHITSWEHAYEFVSGKWTHTDYNFETPTANLRQSSTKVAEGVAPDASKYEVYDFPGEYADPSQAKSDARIRQEEEEVPHDTVSVTSICRTLMPGHTFKLASHSDGTSVSEQNKEYLITSIQHYASQPGPVTGMGAVASYSNSFSCVPKSLQFRPARITPKPVVSGIQTAVVVGPKGEEIHTDEYGRVKVAFHWDREDDDRQQKGRKKANNGEKFFCWVRVGQSIAGNKWGFMAIPRIGQEVVIDFIEGDPDRPLIVGSVYNADQMPHYPLPDHKTRITVRTNSSKGGDGFNELTFEDLKNEERLYMQAQKNMDTRVKNDSKERIYGNRHQIIGWEKDGDKGGSQKEMVYQDKHLNVKANQLEKIEGNYQLCVGNGDADDGGNLDVVIEKQRTEKIGEGNDRVVGQDERVKVGGSLSETIGMDHQTKVGMKQAVEAGQEIHIKAGMKVIIEAGMQLSLVGPGGFVDIGPAGVTIQGIMVKINSGGAAGTGSGCSPAEPEEAQEAAPAKPEQAWVPDH